jgi:DNA-directed RNA polymerase beta subunit
VAVARSGGRIVEIRVYYNVPREDLSPSLQGFLKGADATAASRRAAAADAPPTDIIRSGAPERIDRDKIGGEPIDGVLIMFYILTEDVAGPGDKYVTGSSALKGIVSRVFEPGEEPVDESGQQIDYVISPLSVVSRMTTDVFLNMWTSSTLVRLKQRCLEILDE